MMLHIDLFHKICEYMETTLKPYWDTTRSYQQAVGIGRFCQLHLQRQGQDILQEFEEIL